MEAKTYKEEIAERPIDVSRSLSDEELIEGGLDKVTAFIRTKASGNAERIKKSRSKAETGEDGRTPRKQLNITAPADEASREALKDLAEAMLNKVISPDLIFEALKSRSDPAPTPATAQAEDQRITKLGSKAQSVIDRGGLQAFILRRILE